MEDYRIDFVCMTCNKKTGEPMGVNKSHGGEYPLIKDGEWFKEDKCFCDNPLTGVCVDGTVVAIFVGRPCQN